MKTIINIRKRFPINRLIIMGIVAALMFFSVSCDEFDTETDASITYYSDYDLSITKYFETNSDRFSILYDILDTTGLKHLFKTYGNYTFLAPNNSAFEAFFAEKGKNSYKDFTVGELTKLVRYHVFPNKYLSGSFNSGIVPDKTLTFDYMVSGPSSDGESVLFNKGARIIDKDEDLPNGIIHEIDKVIVKPEASIYDWLKENQADFSIFLEAVEKTGLDQLLTKTEADSGEFFSGFITPDSKYIESNISSFADLAQRISPNDNNYTDTSNVLRSFIASHFTTEIFSMTDASEEHVLFGTVGKATAKYGLRPSTADVVLNYYTEDFPRGLDVDEFNSNNLVSNGIIHVMDTMYMVPKKFLRTNLLYLLAKVPGLPYDSLKELSIQHVIAGTWLDPDYRYWPRDNGPKHLPFHRTNGWLTLNAPYSGFIKFDDHRRGDYNTPQPYLYGQKQPMFFSFEKTDDLLDITWKLPYIIPGKYKLLFCTKTGKERPSVRFEFDGKPVGGIIDMQKGALTFESLPLGIVEIKEGQEFHYLRHIMVTPGTAFHVAVKLEPVD